MITLEIEKKCIHFQIDIGSGISAMSAKDLK